MKNYKIARKDLVRISSKSVREAHLPLSDSRKLMRTARTMKKIAINSWKFGDCGCLVGTTYFNDYVSSFDVERIEGRALANFGVDFDTDLKAFLNIDSDALLIVKVVG